MIVGILILGMAVCYLYHVFVGQRRGLPPGPLPLPIIGTYYLVFLSKLTPQKRIQQYGEKYGPICTVWLGTKPAFFITDFKLLKEFVAGKTSDVFVGRPFHFMFASISDHGFGIVNSEGERWREQRRFVMGTLRDFGFGRNIMERKIVEESQLLTQQIQSMTQEDPYGLHSLDDLLQACVGSIITNVILGHRFDAKDPRFFALKDLLEENFKEMSSPAVHLMGQYSWLSHFPYFSSQYHLIMKNRDLFLDFIQEEIDEHKSKFSSTGTPEDFTGAYLKEMNDRRQKSGDMGYFSEKQLKFILGDLWTAGMETTVTTLKWAILFLVNRPEIQDKVHQELMEHLGHSGESVKMADKQHLPFTVATIMETQRLANIVPVNIPHRTTEDILINGYLIPGNSTVIPQMSAVHINPNLFHEPEQFNPSRFLTSDGKSVQKAEELMPFSMGKRICLGESLARMELFIIFATIFRQFKFSPSSGRLSEKAEIGITLCPKAYSVLIHRRD